MAYIRVAYKTKDVDFDYVPGNRLEVLIAGMKSAIFSGRRRRNGSASNSMRSGARAEMSIKAPNAEEVTIRSGQRAKKPKIILPAEQSRAKIGSRHYGA